MTAGDVSDYAPSRILKGVAVASTALSVATAGTYWRVRRHNPYRPVLGTLTISLKSPHSRLSGLRIGFVTDVHAGPFVDPPAISAVCGLLAAQSPDLVLFGGDYVSESPRFLRDSMPILGQLARSAPLGALAVLGNHDIFVSASKVTQALEQEGIPVLRNESRAIDWRGARMWVAGIDDSLHGVPDLDGTFDQVDTDDPVLALWHEPQFANQVAERGAIAQLSGHSHGGQVKLPGIKPVWLPKHGRKYSTGLNDALGMPVYTSRGSGVYRPPIRLNCPPEVTLITLEGPERVLR